MADTPNRPEDALVESFVAAFPGYVEEQLGVLEAPITPRLRGAIAAATTELDATLSDLMATPVSDQKQSPLELVRAATLQITQLLDGELPYPDRDEQEVEIHPEDRFGLYPATSQDLGDEAWRAHLQWGMEKARAVAGMVPAEQERGVRLPTVAVFGVAVERRTDLELAIRDHGYVALIWRNPADLVEGVGKGPHLALVDLGHPTAHDAVRQLVAADIDVVAVGAGVDDLAIAGVMALGARDVVESDRIIDRLDDLLPRIV